ncbi:MAG: HDOD domain-containing protein [Gammaproteobacteria bacterium]|nr:MAG: HDOD domain-containing protein [Gammaproteobacteria bacterium]
MYFGPNMPSNHIENVGTEFDATLLKHLMPIRELQHEGRSRLLNKARILTLLPGEDLNATEEHRWLLYLLEGKLSMVERGKPPYLLKSDDPRSHHPLFSERDHKLRAIAESPCRILRFDRQFFYTLLDQELINGEELETIEIGEVEGNLFNEIMHAFNVGELKLPSLPEIALKIKTASSNPNVSIQDVSRIVEADPAMVARLIQVANSPISRGYSQVHNIKDAIVRLGLSATRNLVISLAVKQLFQTRSPLLKARMQQLYDHCIEVSAICFALSKNTGKLEPDNVLLAGLVHDIGVIPILTYIEQTGLELHNEQELEDIINKLRSVVGSMVIRYWEFSPDLICVVEDAENWTRDSGKSLDVCDMVIIAQIYQLLQHHQLKGLPRMEVVPAFNKLFHGQRDPGFVGEILQQAREEIAEVTRLLRI